MKPINLGSLSKNVSGYSFYQLIFKIVLLRCIEKNNVANIRHIHWDIYWNIVSNNTNEKLQI